MQEYLEKLYGKDEVNRLANLDSENFGEHLNFAINVALKQLLRTAKRTNKASRVDNVPAELLKQASEKFQDKLYRLTNEIYIIEILPDDFRMSKISLNLTQKRQFRKM